ncbi:CPBP family glutamic-type intramembrane protease [Nesterenkonia sp. CF4.4]|uniref:CPBP family glutamic-type intramembrane protease n=1 Tax=Nesterenkonia sp. CF4.4 TaxID=3373079 RepID=UPI003EE42785
MKPENNALDTDPNHSHAETPSSEPSAPVAVRHGSASKRAAAAERRARGTRTWLEGSRTARAWNGTLLAYTAVAVGAALVLSVAARTQLEAPLGPLLSSVLLWVGMAVPVVIALTRSRPRGLFRFRWTDLLWGLALGVLLRIVQGWLEVAAGSPGGMPSYSTLGGGLNINPMWLLLVIVAPVLILPLLEELLFRGVVLVSVYRMARHGLEAGMLAIVASTGAFVALHAVNGMNRWDEPVYLTLVGLTCGLLVLFTGRIWGAVLVHVVFNGMWVALALTGTALA